MVRLIMEDFYALLEKCRKEQIKEATVTQITDMYNKLLGLLVEDEKTIELRTPYGQAIGKYIKASNTTMDMFNKALAKGNVLMALLK